jgi:hypothetical protein
MHDVFEDNFVNKLNNKVTESNSVSNAFSLFFKSNEESKDNQGEPDYLIFERHFEGDKETGKQQEK